jgi:hypothetical protein
MRTKKDWVRFWLDCNEKPKTAQLIFGGAKCKPRYNGRNDLEQRRILCKDREPAHKTQSEKRRLFVEKMRG